MTYEEAIKILRPGTTFMALAEVEYFGGFNGEEAKIKAVEEACVVACETLEKQIPKKIVKGKDLFWEYQCPNTNCDTQFTRHASYEFCPGCGQAIDWSEYK